MVRVVLNVHPFDVTIDQRKRISSAAGGARVEMAVPNGMASVSPREVMALVTDDAPADIEQWKELRLVQLSSAGYDHLITHPIWQTGVAVTSALGVHAVAMAQYITCVSLMMSRRIPQVLSFRQDRNWQQRNEWYFQGELLRGKTAAVLGYGAIGRETARVLHALGMRIVCVDRGARGVKSNRFCGWDGTGDPTGALPAEWHGLDSLDHVLSESDLVVVTLPLTSETRGLIGRRRLKLMKSTAHIVVASRGGIVEERAFAQALSDGEIAGAAVDCFEQEPLPPTHFLFDTPNLILTPHISGGFQDYWSLLCDLFCQNLERMRDGLPLLNQVKV